MNSLDSFLPPIMQLESTTCCNLDCNFCLRKKLNDSDTSLTFDQFRKIIDKTKCRYLTLHGWGEPLLNPDLPDMIKYASQKKNL